MLERTDATTNVVLEQITFVLLYSTALARFKGIAETMRILHKTSLLTKSQAFLKSINS